MELVLWTEPSWALLLIRLALGVGFVAHGAPKVFGWFEGYGLRATGGSFQALGSPSRQLPKLDVAGSIPVARSKIDEGLRDRRVAPRIVLR